MVHREFSYHKRRSNRPLFITLIILVIIILIILSLFFSEFIYYRSWNGIPIQNKRYIKEGFNGSLIDNNNIIIRAPKAKFKKFAKFVPFGVLVRAPHTYLQTCNITENKFSNNILLKDPNISYEDSRVFKVSDNIGILSYVKRYIDNNLSQLIARYILLSPLNITGPEIVLNFDNKVHKNWILINGENELDTHWTCYLSPYHVVMRVNMNTGEVKKGWRTKSPKFAKNLRGGTNMVKINNKIAAIAHTKSKFPYYIDHQYYELENKPPYRIIYCSKRFKINKNNYIEYPMSLIHIQNDLYNLSFGVDDQKTCICTINLKNFSH